MLSPGRIGFPGIISGNESTEPEEEPPSTLTPSTRSPEEGGRSSGGSKRKRPKFIRKVPCHVCGDVANDHIHYGAIACYSCRAFFRRGVSSSVQFFCSQSNDCKIDKTTRKHCQACRFKKCFDIGMKATWVMTDQDKEEKKRKSLHRKLMAPLVDKEVLRVHTKTNYEERMRNERIQSRVAKKRSRMESKEDIDDKADGADTIADAPEDAEYEPLSPVPLSPTDSLPPLPPLKKIRSDSEAMPPPSMYLASQALLYYDKPEPMDIDSTLIRKPEQNQEDDVQVLGTFNSQPLFLTRKQRLVQSIQGLEYNRQGPSMTFTSEERGYLKYLWDTEMQTAQAIPVPINTLCKIRDAVKSGSVLPMDAAIEGYKICMQRVVEYAKQVDMFSDIPQNDQFRLLLRNIDMIVNIRTARFLRPAANLRDRLADVTGVHSDGPSNAGSASMITSMELQQLFPSTWAANGPYEQQYAKLMKNIFELHMDTQTTTLLSMMALFSCPQVISEDEQSSLDFEQEIQQRQKSFKLLLYRYLVAEVGKVNANRLVEEYQQILGNLERLAEILATKKLRVVELTDM
eukprot:08822.XXX_193514_195557_1 [CDS] Oithona nana genome sequencing.